MAALLALSVRAHPEKVQCQDPRFVDGGKMMGAYVTTNQLSADIVLTANTSQYKYGEAVALSVTTVGPRFENEPKGLYLAVQVEFTASPIAERTP